MTLNKGLRRTIQGAVVVGALALLPAQTSCQSKATPAPPPSGSNTPPPSAPPNQPPVPPATVTTVTGSERVAWDQEVLAGTRNGSLIYAAYVDGIRVDFPGVSCTVRSDTLHECSAPLPRMERGAHTLRLSAIGPSDAPLHGPRSQVLTLIKVDPGAVSAVQNAPQAAGAAGDAFSLEVIAETTGTITDLAATSDGAVFVAELDGRIVSIVGGREIEALQIGDIVRRQGLGLTSIALHPDFDKNRLIYFSYAAETRTGPVWRLARGREVGGRIGEIATMFDGESAVPGSSALIRFGPDRQLYVALGTDAAQQPRAGAYTGKLLRLAEDGQRATNNADGSPIVDSVSGAPAGLTWVQELRLLQTRAGEKHELAISQGPKTLSRFAWEAGRRPAGLAFTPLNGGWLYIATLDRGLQRVRWPPPRGGVGSADASIAGEYTAVRTVSAGADGTIVFGTANSEAARTRAAAASGKNYVIRLRPR